METNNKNGHPNNGSTTSEAFDFSVDDTSRTDNKPTGETDGTMAQQSDTTKMTPQPQIPGDPAPFIVLCGPPTSGKSMILKSLASYLYHSEELGYSISANKTLLNTPLYQDHCDLFNELIGYPDTCMPNTVNYLLADITDKQGNVVAHFLEAPGEDYFSLNDPSKEPNNQFKGYLQKVAQITEGRNRKVIYIIILDLDSPKSFRNDPAIRDKYEKKMVKLYNQFVKHHPSRVILLYNKVDLPQNGLWANANGCSNLKAVYNDAKINYPQLFFQRKFLFWDINDYTFLPYCTGSYSSDGSYTAAGPAFPAALWKEITKIW